MQIIAFYWYEKYVWLYQKIVIINDFADICYLLFKSTLTNSEQCSVPSNGPEMENVSVSPDSYSINTKFEILSQFLLPVVVYLSDSSVLLYCRSRKAQHWLPRTAFRNQTMKTLQKWPFWRSISKPNLGWLWNFLLCLRLPGLILPVSVFHQVPTVRPSWQLVIIFQFFTKRRTFHLF